MNINITPVTFRGTQNSTNEDTDLYKHLIELNRIQKSAQKARKEIPHDQIIIRSDGTLGESKIEETYPTDVIDCEILRPNPFKRIKSKLITAAVGAAVLISAQTGIYMSNKKPDKVTLPFNSNNTSIEQISEIYNVDEDIIIAYNGIENGEDLSERKTIKLPSEYDYIEDKIESNQKRLYSSKLTEDERFKIESETTALKRKHEAQSELAISYTDGDYVYFKISESTPELQKKYGYRGVDNNSFKELFDIKDGELRRYNNIDKQFIDIYDEKGNRVGQDVDYTQAVLDYGSVIKVLKRSINKNDKINLSKYYQQ